ncbi:MAG: hypothetical protein ACYSU0_18270 [Planctomycetota bacterium]
MGAVTGGHVAAGFIYNAGAKTLTINYSDLPEDSYTLTLISADLRFEDTLGYNLDGAPSWPLPSGNGSEGGNFVVNFTTDIGTVAYPTPLAAKLPPGSLIYDPSVQGTITPDTDTDSFTLEVDAGQTITVVVDSSLPLQPEVELFHPTLGSMGVVQAATAGEDAVFQTAAATVTGMYTVDVQSAAGASAGAYTVQVILNAAVEMEEHDGGTNDDLASAEDIDASFISLGGGAARAAVVGLTVTPTFADTQTQSGTLFWPNVLTFDFAGAPPPASDGTLDLEVLGDFDLSSEYVTLLDEGGASLGNYFESGGNQYASPLTATIGFTQAQLAGWAADGTITFEVVPSGAVNDLAPGGEYARLDLSYPTAGGDPDDWYAFTLGGGESATLALTALTGGAVDLELRDDGGALLATGVGGASNVDRVIENFVSTGGGTRS